MTKLRKNPASRSPDSAFEGLVRSIGAPILKKLRSYDRPRPKKSSPRPSQTKSPTFYGGGSTL